MQLFFSNVVKRVLRSVSNSTVAAFVVSVFAGSYSYVFGTDDFEESRIVGWSAGLRHEWFFEDRGPRTTGLGTFLGVPVYDALQGTGNRLPYQASWAQLPFWFLRYVLFWKEFVAFHFLVATFCAMVLCLRALRSWIPELSFWRMILIGFVLLSPLGLYTRQNDWPSWYLGTISLIGLSTALLGKTLTGLAPMSKGSQPGVSTVLCAGVCGLFLATSNPGGFPIAIVCLGSLFLSRIALNGGIRALRSWVEALLRKSFSLALLLVAVLLTLSAVGLDLVSEARSGPGLTASRSERSQGFLADQGFIGISDVFLDQLGIKDQPLRAVRRLPEKVISLAVASVALPALTLFRSILTDFTVFDRIGGSFPRGEFTATLVVIAALYALIMGHYPEVVPLIRRVIVVQICLWFFGALVTADVLPGFFQASSGWQVSPPVLAMNIFLTAVLVWHSKTRKTRIIQGICRANILLVAIWTSLQLTLLSAHPSPQVQIPERKMPFDLTQSEMQAWLAKSKLDESRLALVVTGKEFDSPARIISLFLALALVERPLVSPAPTKIRSNEHLIPGLTLDSGVPPIDLAAWNDSQKFARLLAFLQVKNIVVPLDDPALTNKTSMIGELLSNGLAQETTELRLYDSRDKRATHLPSTVKPEYGLRSFELQRFSLLAPQIGETSSAGKCPLLTGSCRTLEYMSLIESSSTPHVEVCSDECLWKVSIPSVTLAGQRIVLPIQFDKSLAVSHSTESVSTFEYAGFLGIELQSGGAPKSLSVHFKPDALSLLRVLSSYLNSVAVFYVLGVGLVTSKLRHYVAWCRNVANATKGVALRESDRSTGTCE